MSKYDELAERAVEEILHMQRETGKSTEHLQKHYVMEISKDVLAVIIEANEGRALKTAYLTFFWFQIVVVPEGENVLVLAPKGK
jgi:hypothetical protein